ncbi:cupin domain-containing protein [Rhizobium leguminosarum]|uniref:cupin domain-containing protein n=1 Tax=Rhizobium leguminosarum TaxID=384 RepID=UPI001442850F|nr:cupin domain-containing protein [Rhizobium leguminosarum]
MTVPASTTKDITRHSGARVRHGSERSTDLAWLLSPTPVDHFFEACWEQRHLFIGRVAPDYFSALPGIDDVDELITATTPGIARSTDDGLLVRADGNGEPSQRAFRTGANGIPDIHDIYRAYHDGHSVVLNRLHRRSAPIAALCEALEAELHHPVGANMYLTPAHSQGFSAHVDTHDVFILQLHGTKEWHVWSATDELPLASAAHQRLHLAADFERCVLLPGDVLYLPRGVPHEAVTSSSSSLHLTVGIHVYRWLDLLREALEALAMQRPRLRKALPPGFLDRGITGDQLREVIAEASAGLLDEDLMRSVELHLGARLRTEPRVAQPGHFRSIDLITGLTDESRVSRSTGSICTARTSAGEARIEFAGNYVAGPAAMGPAVRFIAENEQFIVHQIPGDLSREDRLDLVSRLVSEGLLYLSDINNTTQGNGHV